MLAGALAGRFVFAYQDMIDRSSGEAPGRGLLLYVLLGALPGLCLVVVAIWGRDDV
jgi:hypothetical protein